MKWFFNITVIFILVPSLLSGCVTAVVPEAAGSDKEPSVSKTIETQEEILRRQEEKLKVQDRELEDLRRQRFYNEQIKTYENKGSPESD